jgi:hypothetical protein
VQEANDLFGGKDLVLIFDGSGFLPKGHKYQERRGKER